MTEKVQQAVVTICPEMLLTLINRQQFYVVRDDGKFKISIDGIPEDAKAMRIGLDEHNNLKMVLTSSEFETTEAGKLLPELGITIKQERVEGLI